MGYVYLTEPGTKVLKNGGVYSVCRKGQPIINIPVNQVEGMVATEHIQLTSEVLMDLMRRNISVHWITGSGNPICRMSSLEQVNVGRHVRQVELLESEFVEDMQEKIIKAKMHNQLTLLKHYERNRSDNDVLIQAIKKIACMIKTYHNAETYKNRMGYEGIAAKYYFEAMGTIVEKPFEFTKRTKRPPKDPFNAMLSFGYTLLLREVEMAISVRGLHPYIGCLHQIKAHHPALASDLMEEWRAVIVDSMVLNMVNRKRISIDEFTEEEDGIYMSDTGRRAFLEEYEKKMMSVCHNGHSYRHLINMQAESYAEALMKADAEIYYPFWWR